MSAAVGIGKTKKHHRLLLLIIRVDIFCRLGHAKYEQFWPFFVPSHGFGKITAKTTGNCF